MKKIAVFLFLLFLTRSYSFGQTISIAAARALPVGSTVTISGVVLNGPELGTIRYVQDGTGGIAVYSFLLASTDRGDLVSVTGTTDDFNNLLEINPVSTWNIISTGNQLPLPAIILPVQLDEPLESRLVQIDNVTFSNPGGTFTGNATFGFSANGQNGVIYVRSNSPLVGMIIPLGNVTLTGICSQNNAAYQLLPRDSNDIVFNSSIYFTLPPAQMNMTSSGFDVTWQTNIAGSTFIQYGNTPLLGNTLAGAGGVLNHTVTINGANPSEVIYVKAFSVSGLDTAYSETKIFITASASTGSIKAYFNRSVDHNVASSPANYAIRLNNSIADTLSAYIDRCQFTLDIAIYNFDNANTGAIIQAINNAYARGVQIRIISDGSNNNAALNSINANIPKVSSPVLPASYYGIMHNKFVIIDANAADPGLPVVWTGSTNWSDNQLNTDANNVIIFQDQSLATGYTMEFNEMWGSSGQQPVPANAKFGPDKTDNTPHEYLIGGKRVEAYFSPSDQVNSRLIQTINSADAQLFFSTFVFTRYDLAFAIEDRVIHGVQSAGVIDDSSNGGGYAFGIMQAVMGNNLLLYDHNSFPGILHHKYLIVDQKNAAWDPLVLTGSHNWSSTANLKNDENTVIVHDVNTANQYYQEFYKRFTENGGILGVLENVNHEEIFYRIFPVPANDQLFVAINSNVVTTCKLAIINSLGQYVSLNQFNVGLAENVYRVNLSGFAKGLYILEMETGNGVSNHKLIIN